MSELEITCVVWHREDHHIEVIYVDGKPDHLIGPEGVAAELAPDTGLRLNVISDEARRWVRD